MAILEIKEQSRFKGLDDVLPGGAIGFEGRTFDAINTVYAASTSPLSTFSKSGKSLSAPKDEPELAIAKKATLSGKFSDQAEDQDKSAESTKLFMLVSMWATQNADENGTVSGNSFVNIIEVLKNQFGIDTSPVEKLIERVTGTPYAEFKNSAQNTNFDVSGFYHQDTKGNRSPIIRNGGFDSDKVLRIAASDNAGAGNCAKGVANIAEGLGWDVQRGHATEWDKTLPRNGWVKLQGANAHNAPEGAVLVYNSDIELGKKARNSGGGVYGHVEFVAEGANGQKLFVSDKARNNAGGSVPNNFAGAYIYVGDNAPASNLAIARNFNQGISLASHGPTPPNLG
ncbi:MAG: hypothetical protein DI586_07615 [Micavibrio aeruginosavorus]|uniref:Peptidase C51 domain-containing protein n=1 Tax=Micavibrio aeruginosavorus TaxID=349221 RepID=A0A2W5FH09_9BACT|nr:MAG: hypothetical protein DI586_07615 [Micavibrio aeruginosavorus]